MRTPLGVGSRRLTANPACPRPTARDAGLLPLFLSTRGLYTYYRLQRYAFPLLIVLLWGVPAVFHIDPIGAYFRHTVDPLLKLLVPR